MKKKLKGFTLIELVIALSIVAILSTIAVTLYTSHIRKARRADAMNTMAAIALAEERYRTTNTQYGTLAQVWGGVSTSPEGYYTLSIAGVSGTAYSISAQAIGDQAYDTQDGTPCMSLQLIVSNGALVKTPSTCWSK